MTKWTRRDFLRTALAASALPLLGVDRLLGASNVNSTGSSGGKLFLFLDWFHVKKGELQVTLDPKRISEEGHKLLETYSRDFKKTFDQTGHGFKPLDIPSGIRIVQEVAERSKPWLIADQPWEQQVSSPTVIFDQGRFRCWYNVTLAGERQKTTVDQERVMEVSGSALAYAESPDGWNWTKPSLGILSFKGSKENNLVSSFSNGGSVFRDDHGPEEERYKAFYFDELPKDEIPSGAASKARYGLYGIFSPDGYRWKRNPKPLVRYFSDTVNIAAWDAVLSRYVGFFRHHLSGRTISRAETEDFWNWPDPQPLMYAGPMDSPADDYYSNCYTTYPGLPSLRLLFPAIYHHHNDSVDVRFGISRDGRAFQWISYSPIIKRGAAGEWDGGSIYAEPNLVQLPDGRLALPCNAYSTTHNEVFFKNFYGGGFKSSAGVGWALWQDARLAGIDAEHHGQFTMNSTVFNGKHIQVNFRSRRSGRVEIELREKGKPIPGFSFADCSRLRGDHLWEICRWKGGIDLSRFNGKYLELGVRLESAKLFALRFSEQKEHESERGLMKSHVP